MSHSAPSSSLFAHLLSYTAPSLLSPSSVPPQSLFLPSSAPSSSPPAPCSFTSRFTCPVPSPRTEPLPASLRHSFPALFLIHRPSFHVASPSRRQRLHPPLGGVSRFPGAAVLEPTTWREIGHVVLAGASILEQRTLTRGVVHSTTTCPTPLPRPSTLRLEGRGEAGRASRERPAPRVGGESPRPPARAEPGG